MNRATAFKVLAFVINVAVVVYLLLAKRLFGLRGGAAADEAEDERDQGWGRSSAPLTAARPPAAPRPRETLRLSVSGWSGGEPARIRPLENIQWTRSSSPSSL